MQKSISVCCGHFIIWNMLYKLLLAWVTCLAQSTILKLLCYHKIPSELIEESEDNDNEENIGETIIKDVLWIQLETVSNPKCPQALVFFFAAKRRRKTKKHRSSWIKVNHHNIKEWKTQVNQLQMICSCKDTTTTEANYRRAF